MKIGHLLYFTHDNNNTIDTHWHLTFGGYGTIISGDTHRGSYWSPWSRAYEGYLFEIIY